MEELKLFINQLLKEMSRTGYELLANRIKNTTDIEAMTPEFLAEMVWSIINNELDSLVEENDNLNNEVNCLEDQNSELEYRLRELE